MQAGLQSVGVLPRNQSDGSGRVPLDRELYREPVVRDGERRASGTSERVYISVRLQSEVLDIQH